MDEPEKSHSCDAPGCNMQFEDVDHLVVHKKKHEMVLNFGNGQKNTFVADQTPTPTRFIRNCEELGLFQDLQNVNPFEETFRKAVETGKTGYNALQEVEHLQVAAGSDDTLHTPHVFPYITEDAPGSTSPGRSIVSSLVLSSAARPRSNSSDDVKVITVATKVSEEMIVPDMSTDLSKVIVLQEGDISQRTKQCSSVELRVGDGGVKTEPGVNAGGMQLLLRMPDGKLVALSNLQSTNNSLHPTVLTFAPAQSTPSRMQASCNSVDSLLVDAAAKNDAAEPKSSCQQAKVSLAKLKLKEVLTSVSKTRAKNNGASVVDIAQPSKVCIPRRSTQEINKITDLQPSSTSSAQDNESADSENDASEKKRKFLERNRAAAMRCREKRRTWIQELERRSRDLEATNQHLQTEVASLRAEVAQLKTLLLAHKDCPVTQALAQGAQVTISSPPQQQVISMTLPVAEAAGGVVLTNAVPSRIVSPPSTLATPTSVLTLNPRVVRQGGALKRRHTVSSARSPALAPAQRVRPSPAMSQSILVPPGPQIISVAGLQPSTTYILTATPRVEPLHVIKVNPNAAPPARADVRKMDVDSDSDVEVVGEIQVSVQPNS